MRARLILEGVLRYALSIIMMSYGIIKIFKIQFSLPSEVYNLSIGELDGVTLTWAFLGFSSWFSVLLGVFEFVPSALLLFTRTKLIGAVLLFPMLLTVFLINNAYGFLTYMRVFTGMLLLMNICLLFLNRNALIKILKSTIYQAPKNQRTEFTINILIIVIVIVSIVLIFKV